MKIDPEGKRIIDAVLTLTDVDGNVTTFYMRSPRVTHNSHAGVFDFHIQALSDNITIKDTPNPSA